MHDKRPSACRSSFYVLYSLLSFFFRFLCFRLAPVLCFARSIQFVYYGYSQKPSSSSSYIQSILSLSVSKRGKEHLLVGLGRAEDYLNAFVHWCSPNLLRLCPEKCSVISFSPTLSPILFNYTLSNSSLSRVMSIRDLGIIFDSRLNFKLQLDEVLLLKVNRTLGIILRFTSTFRDQSCLRNLYCALIRHIIQYACII